ncbi:hypothetical protein [Citricoccus sp. GCM10030269]|uniref:hypothetical protein n=1 Tax=Citricoccus sp. GCM10030269 TaxID=3273388 RepID=UPI00361956E6
MSAHTKSAEPDAAVVDAALADFTGMMAQDGYQASWKPESADQIAVSIEAGPEACADCLSPTPIMEAILQKALSETPYSVGKVSLPSGH